MGFSSGDEVRWVKTRGKVGSRSLPLGGRQFIGNAERRGTRRVMGHNGSDSCS